jgi:hypothetical protein
MAERLDAADNLINDRTALHQFLDEPGLGVACPRIGQHPSGGWPGEASFFVLGVGAPPRSPWAANSSKMPIVWCGPDAVPQLFLLP